MNNVKHLKNTAAPELCQLFARDRITFSVLEKILRTNCSDIFTDEDNFIICYSSNPYPVWIWHKKSSTAELNSIAEILNEHFPTASGYRYNMDYELYSALSLINESFAKNDIAMGLISYELMQPIAPRRIADGSIEAARHEDIEELTDMLCAMSLEGENVVYPRDNKRIRVQEMIDSHSLYVWRASNGRIAATTSVGVLDDICRIGSVYTRPEMRRNGYAMNLVYNVCILTLAKNLRPILYTDGGYTASNDCYRKIGFCEIGRLCNISAGKEGQNG